MKLRNTLLIFLLIGASLIFQACPKPRTDLINVEFQNHSAGEILVLNYICSRNNCDSVYFARKKYNSNADLYSEIVHKVVKPNSSNKIQLGTENGVRIGYNDTDDWFIIFDKEKFLATDWNDPNAPRDFILKVVKASSWDDLVRMNFTVTYP